MQLADVEYEIVLGENVNVMSAWKSSSRVRWATSAIFSC